jgi:hypothetical protein
VGEEQRQMSFISFAMRSVVRIAGITSKTLALETAFFIDARLRARSWLQALVHIYTHKRKTKEQERKSVFFSYH